MAQSIDELRREIELAMQDDDRMFSELRAQLERARAFLQQDRSRSPRQELWAQDVR